MFYQKETCRRSIIVQYQNCCSGLDGYCTLNIWPLLSEGCTTHSIERAGSSHSEGAVGQGSPHKHTRYVAVFGHFILVLRWGLYNDNNKKRLLVYQNVGNRFPANLARTAQNKNAEGNNKNERFVKTCDVAVFVFQVRSGSTRYDVGQRHVPAATHPSAGAVSFAAQGTGLSQTSSETTPPMLLPHQHLYRAKNEERYGC